jgi:hypothetical protein
MEVVVDVGGLGELEGGRVMRGGEWVIGGDLGAAEWATREGKESLYVCWVSHVTPSTLFLHKHVEITALSRALESVGCLQRRGVETKMKRARRGSISSSIPSTISLQACNVFFPTHANLQFPVED